MGKNTTKLIAGKYTLADIFEIQRTANKTIDLEALEWFPSIPLGQFQVSSAQVRHILEAIATLGKDENHAT